MRWDIFAAVVALAGIPFTLSSASSWLLRVVTQRLMRMIIPDGSTCDRLQWSDIPSGPLRAYLNKEALQERDYYGGYGPSEQTLKHDEEQCFASTIGKVFQNAWISAQRRDQRVIKPYQLDPRKTYIRTDAKTLRAYALMSHEEPCSQYDRKPVISFKDIDGVLTAHFSASRVQLPDVSKEEVEAILDGYPPFYLEKIYISENDYVTTPILRFEDITRGGWIVAVGLDYYNSAPLFTHNMESSKIKDNSVSRWHTRSMNIPWKTTTIASAVKRFGHALGNIQRAFPDNTIVESARSFFACLMDGKYDLDHTHPMHVLYYCQGLGRDDTYWQSRSYIKSLSSQEWQRAMHAFNHYESLTPEEENLFCDFMLPILQAAFVGLLHVMLYGNHYRASLDVWKLPSFPELEDHKYIYLRTCEIEKE